MIEHFNVKEKGFEYDARTNLILQSHRKNFTEIKDDERFSLVFLELTKRCNLACTYCYQTAGLIKKNLEKTTDEKYQLLSSLLNSLLQTKKNMRIIFYGGEPLLEFDLLKRLTDFCDKKMVDNGCSISYEIVTNGVLLNEQIVDFLIDKKFITAISMDGNTETMFRNRGINNVLNIECSIKKLHEKGLPAKILATIQKESIFNFENDIDYLLSLPVNTVKFVPCDSLCASLLLSAKEAKKFCNIFESKVKNGE